MIIILLLLQLTWLSAPGPGHTHSRAAHARHLRHIQQARHRALHKALTHRHGAPHPSLIK